MKEWFDKWSKNELMVAIIGAIVGAIASGVVTYFVTVITASGNPMIERYFAIDTASTLIDSYLVDMGYVDDSILEVESLDQQFQIIYESFTEYDEAVQDALTKMGKDQEEVSKMERAALLSELPYLAEATVKNSSDKDKTIEKLNEDKNKLIEDNEKKQSKIDDYEKRKEAELLASYLIIDGELMNNGDSINNAVAKVDGNNYYAETFLNSFILWDQIKYDLQEKSVIVGSAKPEKVKFSWDAMVSDPHGPDPYIMGDSRTFSMAKNSYSEGIVLSPDDNFYVHLDGDYSKLTFTYGHVDGAAQDNLELTIFSLDENGETYTNVLKRITLAGEMRPKEIEVPLGYAEAIKLVVSGGYYQTLYGLTNIYFYS